VLLVVVVVVQRRTGSSRELTATLKKTRQMPAKLPNVLHRRCTEGEAYL